MADKGKTPRPEPKKFSGKIRLYWQEFGDKEDIISEVHDPEAYACFEILHGLYHLETYEKWQDDPDFTAMHEKLWMKCEAHVDRIKKLRRIHKDKWDWDWVD